MHADKFACAAFNKEFPCTAVLYVKSASLLRNKLLLKRLALCLRFRKELISRSLAS
jgi:hypothetical protein